MRTLTSTGAVVTAAVCSLLFAPSALATPHDDHGDNGTVKIHDSSTGEELRKNEPHVCSFYLDAFGFDGGQQVDWRIEAWAPAAGVKGEAVESGSLALNASGHGRSGDLSLPDGHYKLFWTFDGEKGRAKHKVFWSECEKEDTPPGKGDEPGRTPGDEPAGTPGGAPEGRPSAPSATAPAEPAPGPAPSADGSSDDLAETGSSVPVGLLAATATGLLVAGGCLVVRRRRSGTRA